MSQVGAGFFGHADAPLARAQSYEYVWDPEAPLGSQARPLGSPEYAARSYLLGLSCACGRSSLAFAAALDASEALACPHCQASLT